MEKYPISKKPGQKASLSYYYQQQWRKNSNSVLSVQIERKKKTYHIPQTNRENTSILLVN